MKKRLILHIGMHKTGTSSVQRYFSRNRAMLRRMGVCYPLSVGKDGARQPKHASIFDAISHEADHGRPDPDLGPSSHLIEQAAAELENAPGRWGVISAEGLSGERSVFAESMSQLNDRFDTTVVIFVRRQDHWVESFYKQMVLSRSVREARGFHAFVAAATTRDHMNYHQIVGWWRQHFEDIRVMGFHPTGRLRPLMRLLDIMNAGRPMRWLPFAHAHENASPGADAVEVVRRRNENGEAAPRNAAALIDAKLGRSCGRYFMHEERVRLLKTFEKGNRQLLREMPDSDHSCLIPNMTEIGRSRELRWKGEISAQFSSNSLRILNLNH